MSHSTLQQKNVKIRKQQRCIGCDKLFSPGTELFLHKFASDGRLFSNYWCKPCQDVTEDWDLDCWEFFTPGEISHGTEQEATA